MDEKLMKHGAISWFELMTSDVAAAKEFYSALFCWEYEPFDGDPATEYNVVKVDGEMVAGIMKTPPQCTNQPPCWGTYITVKDIDATAAKIERLGGKIIVPPTDIPTVGRFCMFTDPQGAVLSAITYFPQQ
ncbi:MAG: VOC family protein [Desulforhopalus sp.]